MVKCLLPLLPKRPVVVDIGANKGEWSELIPDPQLRMFEPNEIMHNYLKIKFPKAHVSDLVVWSEETDLDFHYCTDEHNEVSSVFENKAWSLPYRIVRKRTCVVDFECDLLKIDAEGSEYSILKGMTTRPKFIQFEYGEMTKVAGQTLKGIVELLTEIGYQVFDFDGVGFKPLGRIIENFRLTNFIASTENLGEFKTFIQIGMEFSYRDFLERMAEQMPMGTKALFVGKPAAAVFFRECLKEKSHRVVAVGSEVSSKFVELCSDELKAARNFDEEMMDFVFFDSNADYHTTKTQLRLWIDKVKPNGVIAGFDYSVRSTGEAVRSCVPKVHLNFEYGIWWAVKDWT